MDRTNDQRRTSPPNYNRPRDQTPHRINSYPSEREYGSSSHYMSSRGHSDYPMREPQMLPSRYDEREEESQLMFRGQVPYGGNAREPKPYGRPPIPLQPYDRRPSYRGGHSYNPYPRPPPNRDYGPPSYNNYTRGNSMQHQPYQRPYSGPPFPPASHRPPPNIFPHPPKLVQIPAYAPVLEEKLAQLRAEGQRLREAGLKLDESVRKSERELEKSLWELEKVNHNTALATRQVEILCTKEEIEKIEKLTTEKEVAERERESEILE
ncbi:hypothetical protein RclHR1_06180024 [Rhizophagus clarus]|uniref:Uncharacterized protein n=1 Tax=Rhizophagus clarus TaxID=94130 RepID=A0A2Z6SI28_9GLOM|nr:hypothetical protein RclHR1_06180024 [Rhizophagus clarus]GES87878.1 hypothetical protein GLOIN_2v1477064 [Rhizophagus clarus]